MAVLGMAVFVCYTWAMLGFFNKLSSFLLYFTLPEIGSIFTFMMAFTLLESLAVTGGLVLLSAILPAGWLRQGFALKSFLFLAAATLTSILFQKSLGDHFPSVLVIAAVAILPVVLTVVLTVLIRSRPGVQKVLAGIQDRVSIMLFVYVPIGLLSLAVVLYRSLL